MPSKLLNLLLHDDLKLLLDRIDTSGLRQGETPTKVLVVFNRDHATASGIAVFHARFPVRAITGPQPVTVRDGAGRVIPSRVVNESLRELPGFPQKNLWEFDLRFYVENVPAHGWRAYAATYGLTPESAGDAALWREPDHPALTVAETDCRRGDLPAVFSLLPSPLSDNGTD